jgi:hypothetical protein
MDLTKANRRCTPGSGSNGRVVGAPRFAAAGLAVALAAGFIAVTAQAAMYKWVDEKGVTHYTDTMPTDAVNKASTELNRQGLTVKKIEPAQTPEQRKAIDAEAERKREEAKQQQEAARRDRALLDSYTTESDIDLAKNRSLKTIATALQSAQAYSAQLTKRKNELLANKAALGAKPVPANLERELASLDAELGRQVELIERKQRDQVTITAKYDLDKARWQALKGATSASGTPVAGGVATAPAAAGRTEAPAASAAPPKK